MTFRTLILSLTLVLGSALSGHAELNEDNRDTTLTYLSLYNPKIAGDDTTPEKRHQERMAAIRKLLEQGANADGELPSYYPSPLHLASIAGNKELISLLLQYGANPNAVVRDGLTPLHDACAGCADLEAVQLLVQGGANVNQYALSGRSPLMHACIYKKGDIVRYLLEQGADAGAWCHSSDDPTCVVINGIIIPALPTLAYCFMEEEDSHHGESSWHIAGMIFKALSPLQQLSYILCALLLIAPPFLVLGLIIWLIYRLIRFIKRKKQQS